MARNEKTSKMVGKTARRLLRTSKSKSVKSVSGSALTQRPDRKESFGDSRDIGKSRIGTAGDSTNSTGPRKK